MKRHLYAWLIRLYPAAFRDEFGDELLDVFTAKCADARQSGLNELLAVWFHELAELPWNLFTEYWLLLRSRMLKGGFEMGMQPDKKAAVTVLIPIILGVSLWIINPTYMNKFFSSLLGGLFLSCVLLILAVNTLLILGYWEKSRLWIGLLAVLAVMIIMFAPAFLHLIASGYIASALPGTIVSMILALCDLGLLIALIVLAKKAKDVRGGQISQ